MVYPTRLFDGLDEEVLTMKRDYLTIRKAAELYTSDVNPATKLPTLYSRFRRKIVRAYESGKWGEGIKNITNGKKNFSLLIDRAILSQVLEA